MLHQYVGGNFPTFDGTGLPEIATAALTAIGSGGEANQSSNKNPYREPPLASNWKPIGDVAAMLVRRLDAARRKPPNSLTRRKKARLGAGLKNGPAKAGPGKDTGSEHD
jgi:hypothetical protein